MAKQVRVEKQTTTTKTTEVEEVKAKTSTKAEALKEEMDDLLAAIDEVLDEVVGESTAAEMVASYIQRGGQ